MTREFVRFLHLHVWCLESRTLLLAWLTTAGHKRVYLSDRRFPKLSLDVQCDVHRVKRSNFSATHCAPYYDEYDSNSDDSPLTTTSVFFEMLEGGTFGGKSDEDSQSATSFVALLGNLMMNGMFLCWVIYMIVCD